MNNVEFRGYRPYPSDPYLLGIATIRVTVELAPNIKGKLVLRYKHVKDKNGGTFFAAPSYSVMDNGEKKFISATMFDSRDDEEQIQEWLRQQVRAMTPSALEPVRSMDELAAISGTAGGIGASVDAPLPF